MDDFLFKKIIKRRWQYSILFSASRSAEIITMLFNYMYCFVYFTIHIKIVMSFSLGNESKHENKGNSDVTLVKERDVSLMSIEEMNNAATNNNTKIRTKRQNSGGAGKFTDAAKMPQIKILRLYMQLFKNFWDAAYVGGAHPLHPEIPKIIVSLYKQKIVEFFIPDVGKQRE